MKTFKDLGFDNTASPLGSCSSDSFLNLILKVMKNFNKRLVFEAFMFNKHNEKTVAQTFENQMEFIRFVVTKKEAADIFRMWDFLKVNRISHVRTQVNDELRAMIKAIEPKGIDMSGEILPSQLGPKFTFTGLGSPHFASSVMVKEFPSFRKKQKELLISWVIENKMAPADAFENDIAFFKATMTPEWFEWFITTFNNLRERGITMKGVLTEEEKQQMAPPF